MRLSMINPGRKKLCEPEPYVNRLYFKSYTKVPAGRQKQNAMPQAMLNNSYI